MRSNGHDGRGGKREGLFYRGDGGGRDEPEIAADGGVAEGAEEVAVAADLGGVAGVVFAELVVDDGDGAVGADDYAVRPVQTSVGIDDSDFVAVRTNR